MPSSSAPARQRNRTQTYLLYALRGRIYAANARKKLIDLGRLDGSDGAFGFALDGEDVHGQGFATAEDALRGVADKVGFLFLDGQFTSLPDQYEFYMRSLPDAPQLELTVPETAEGAAQSPPAV